MQWYFSHSLLLFPLRLLFFSSLFLSFFFLTLFLGIGIQKFADQRIYKGQWSNNKKHGYGVMIWPNGEKSEGYWQNNVRCGLSIFTDAEGRRYEEKWKNGAREGNKHMLGRKGICLFCDYRSLKLLLYFFLLPLEFLSFFSWLIFFSLEVEMENLLKSSGSPAWALDSDYKVRESNLL